MLRDYARVRRGGTGLPFEAPKIGPTKRSKPLSLRLRAMQIQRRGWHRGIAFQADETEKG